MQNTVKYLGDNIGEKLNGHGGAKDIILEKTFGLNFSLEIFKCFCSQDKLENKLENLEINHKREDKSPYCRIGKG